MKNVLLMIAAAALSGCCTRELAPTQLTSIECEVDNDCPDASCYAGVCAEGRCQADPAPAGYLCSTPTGLLSNCDGAGWCKGVTQCP